MNYFNETFLYNVLDYIKESMSGKCWYIKILNSPLSIFTIIVGIPIAIIIDLIVVLFQGFR